MCKTVLKKREGKKKKFTWFSSKQNDEKLHSSMAETSCVTMSIIFYTSKKIYGFGGPWEVGHRQKELKPHVVFETGPRIISLVLLTVKKNVTKEITIVLFQKKKLLVYSSSTIQLLNQKLNCEPTFVFHIMGPLCLNPLTFQISRVQSLVWRIAFLPVTTQTLSTVPPTDLNIWF